MQRREFQPGHYLLIFAPEPLKIDIQQGRFLFFPVLTVASLAFPAGHNAHFRLQLPINVCALFVFQQTEHQHDGGTQNHGQNHTSCNSDGQASLRLLFFWHFVSLRRRKVLVLFSLCCFFGIHMVFLVCPVKLRLKAQTGRWKNAQRPESLCVMTLDYPSVCSFLRRPAQRRE